MNFRTLTIEDFEALYSLYKPSAKTLGHMPKDAFKDYLKKGRVLGCIQNTGEIVGYLMFGTRRDGRVRIAHLCVDEDKRGKGIARKLFEAFVSSPPTDSTYIKVSCRKDYAANKLWPKLGFFPIDEKKGRSKEGHLLQIWLYDLHPDKQDHDGLSLWQAQVSEEKTRAAIDANILFDLDRDDESDAAIISKALLADHLAEDLKLHITEEMFIEIERHTDEIKRKTSRNTAGGFTKINYRRAALETFQSDLKTILPHRSQSEISDLRHLAMVAASDVSIFITRDAALLSASDKIKELVGVEVIAPATIISQIDNFSQEKETSNIGLGLRWAPLGNQPIDGQNIQLHGEKKTRLQEKIDKYKSLKESYRVHGLFSGNTIVAIKAEEHSNPGEARVVMARVLRSQKTKDCETAANYIIASSLANCLKQSIELLTFKVSECCPRTINALEDFQFAFREDSAYRYIIPRTGQSPRLNRLELEKQYPLPDEAPLGQSFRFSAPFFSLKNENNYIIPIKPGYAMSLFDEDASAEDMFGGIPETFTRWDNTYYRSNTMQYALRAPGRIFWHVSGGTGIVAISHLDAVEVGLPKKLFSKNKKRGILNWREVYNLCKHDTNIEIMALNFSCTFQFRQSIKLDQIRKIFRKHQSSNFNPVSAIRISKEIAEDLYEAGFSTDE